ncbi:TonB-dependent receptor [Paludibacter sp.]
MKVFYTVARVVMSSKHNNMLKTMLICFLISMVSNLFANNYILSQKEDISLNISNKSIKEVLKEIEAKSSYVFLMSESAQEELTQRVSIIATNEAISSVIQRLLKNTNLSFKITEKQISIFSNKSSIKEPKTSPPTPPSIIKKNINGRVIDLNGEAVIAAIVRESNKPNNVVVTNNDGYFNISVSYSSITISSLGFTEKTVAVTDRKDLLIVRLEESTQNLDEIVVVGYGTQSKLTVTGAVTFIKSEDILKAPTANVANALGGRLSGVSFIQQSGQPGSDDPIIRIRGVSTLGDPLSSASDPLVLVDGVERGFSGIDPSEIESVTVLKDAASTAVYGVRGANGVVIVNTKRGSSGKPVVSYNGQFGVQQPTRMTEYVGAYEYVMAVNEGQANDGIPLEHRGYSPEVIEIYRTNSQPLLYPSMKWMDYLVRSFAPQHKHNLSIQGGTDVLRYFVSLGVLSQEGMFKKFKISDNYDPSFNYSRYNFRSNFDFYMTPTTVVKLTSGAIIGDQNGPNADVYESSNNLWFALQAANPLKAVGIIDGKKVVSEERQGRVNPLDILYFSGFKNTFTNNLNMDITLEQDLKMLLKGLKIHGKVSYDSYYSLLKDRKTSFPTYLIRESPGSPGGIVMLKSGQEGSLSYSETYSKSKKIYSEVGLNYNLSLNNNRHNITALLLYNQQKRWYPNMSQQDIPTAYMGLVGRLTYNYQLKYLFDFNLGYNGSENFAPKKRFGLFPAVSVGWVASEENFFKENIDLINYLKFRYSYGTVGKDNLGALRFYYLPDRYGFVPGYYFGGTTSVSPGAKELTLGNPDVGWEIAEKQNLAMEMTLFKQQLNFTVEYFNEYRSNILINRRSTPAFVAAELPPQNLGIVRNKGIEFELNWSQTFKDFRYNVGGNFAYAKNKIIFNDEPLSNYKHQWETGRPIGQHFGYEFDGFFYDEQDVANSPLYSEASKPGDVKYKDINGDGVITPADITAIGYPKYPEITYGINSGLQYKNFDLSLLFQGSARVSIELSDEYILPYLSQGPVLQYMWDERWTPETKNTATYPRFIAAPSRDHNNYMTSSLWVKDASYIRLKNIDLGYTIAKHPFLKKMGINKVRIGANGTNLLTFTGLSMSDPEAKSSRAQLYPTMKVYNINMNVQF